MHTSKYFKIWIQSILAGILISALDSLSFAAGSYTHDVPYQQAVPHLIDAIKVATIQVKDDQELQDIAQWEQNTRTRLPEFLEDLQTIAQSLEDNGTSAQYIFEQYQTFADKWNQIISSYPGLNELEPALKPIINKIFEGLPSLQPPSSDNPLSSFADLYKKLEALNPWDIGRLFKIPALPSDQKVKSLHENSHESTMSGVKMIDVHHREVKVTRNGVIVFYELIQNDQVTQRSVEFRDPSLIHEVLNQMSINSEDPLVIQALQQLVDLIDLHLQTAYQNGVLDECSYSYLYRKEFTGQLSYCADYFANQQNYQKMLKPDPEDHVNQVFLSNPKDFWQENVWQNFETSSSDLENQHQEQMSSSVLNDYIAPPLPVIPPQAVPFVVIPGTLISLAGLFKLF